MRRVDHDHDPDAPLPTERRPGAGAAVRDGRGRLLLVRREDNGRWTLPGGRIELDETAADAAVRETREEAGVEIEVTGLVGVYTDPQHVTAYEDGAVLAEFTLCFHARLVAGSGAPQADGVETTAVAWVEPERVGDLVLHTFARRPIQDALSGSTVPRLG